MSVSYFKPVLLVIQHNLICNTENTDNGSSQRDVETSIIMSMTTVELLILNWLFSQEFNSFATYIHNNCFETGSRQYKHVSETCKIKYAAYNILYK